MPTPIRVLYFADNYIGRENYGRIDSSTGINTRVLDFLRRFGEVVNYGLAHDVDLVIFAGMRSRRAIPIRSCSASLRGG